MFVDEVQGVGLSSNDNEEIELMYRLLAKPTHVNMYVFTSSTGPR